MNIYLPLIALNLYNMIILWDIRTYLAEYYNSSLDDYLS